MKSFTCSVSPEDARAYLTLLLDDYLDAACFELIPLELLERDLHPLKAGSGDGLSPEAYRELLQEKVAEDDYRRTEAVDLADIPVPEDVLAIVIRRLTPIFKTFLKELGKGGCQ